VTAKTEAINVWLQELVACFARYAKGMNTIMDTREHDIRLYTDHLNFILYILKILIYSNKIKKPGVHFNNDMNEGFGFSCFYSYVQCMSKQIEKKSEVGFNKSTGIWHVQLEDQESCEAGLPGQSEAVQEITCQLDSKYSRNR